MVSGLIGCTVQSEPVDGPEQVVCEFVRDYGNWAQAGFTEDVPDELERRLTGDALVSVEGDARWFSESKIVQSGAPRVASTEIVDSAPDEVTVRLTLDTSAVSYTSHGKKPNSFDVKVTVTDYTLVRQGTWKIASSKSVDDGIVNRTQ